MVSSTLHHEVVYNMHAKVKDTNPSITESGQGVDSLDPELFAILRQEKQRQRHSIELIASENFTSLAVRQCLSSCPTNKYSEGRPGARYYGGNDYIDAMEVLCERRALAAFSLNGETWQVNVQSLSGSPANLAVFIGLLDAGDRVMGLALPDGGHLSHGFAPPNDAKFTAGSAFYQCGHYHVDQSTGMIDEIMVREEILAYKPKLLIAGGSACPRTWNWAFFRQMADEVGAYLLVDMSHISGLIATGLHPSPFPHADVVTTTTHKTLRGPRSAIIFINAQRLGDEVARSVHKGVFPGVQGGPHNHQIAAVAAQLREVTTDDFRSYQTQVINNCQNLSRLFVDHGYTVVTGGTDTHLMLIDVKRSAGVTGSKVEMVADLCDISLNKNTVPGDKSPLSPSGIRIGTPAMTSRGCKQNDMRTIFEVLHDAIQLTRKIQLENPSAKNLKVFQTLVLEDEAIQNSIKSIRDRVHAFAIPLSMPAESLVI